MTNFMTQRRCLRLVGNWGVSFVGPLVGANALSVEFIDTILIAMLSSTIVTALVFFRQLERYGEQKNNSS